MGGTLWALGACSLPCVISAHTLGGVGERAFLCGVYIFSPCLLGYPHKKHAVILVSILPPPGQPGRLMEEKGTGWNNVFLPHATSYWGISPLSGDKKRPARSSCTEGSMSSVRGSPQVGRERVAPRITA